MAKRKRLSPAQAAFLPGQVPQEQARAPATPGLGRAEAAPIARVARDAAASAALEEVATELTTARAEGRLVQSLPIAAIAPDYIVRDRVLLDQDDLAALKASLQARGQQTPIEVVELGQGRFGLISGWRRLSALQALFRETGEARFATVQALLRRPETAGDAYTAMVEENEIRVGLSPFERARIVAKSVEQGVFPDERAALRTLFASASRAKRSKIGSFLRIVAELDGMLRFPWEIAERLGLRIAKALDADPDFSGRLREKLHAEPPATAQAELTLIERALRGGRKRAAEKPPASGAAGVVVSRKGRKLTLQGACVTPAFEARLRAWLREQNL
jgi:ParB-like chromosome segregation protein Spo0J